MALLKSFVVIISHNFCRGLPADYIFHYLPISLKLVHFHPMTIGSYTIFHAGSSEHHGFLLYHYLRVLHLQWLFFNLLSNDALMAGVRSIGVRTVKVLEYFLPLLSLKKQAIRCEITRYRVIVFYY